MTCQVLSRRLGGVTAIVDTAPATLLTEEAVPQLVGQMTQAGVDAIAVNGAGTQGNGHLTEALLRSLVALQSEAEQRLSILAGVPADDLDAAQSIARGAVWAGADGLLVDMPPGFGWSETECASRLGRLRDVAGDTPILLHLRNRGVSAEALQRLLILFEITAVVWAVPCPAHLAAARALAPESVRFIDGVGGTLSEDMRAAGTSGVATHRAVRAPAETVATHRRAGASAGTGDAPLHREAGPAGRSRLSAAISANLDSARKKGPVAVRADITDTPRSGNGRANKAPPPILTIVENPDP